MDLCFSSLLEHCFAIECHLYWVLAMVMIAAGSVEEVAVAGGVDVMVAVGAVVEDLEDLVAAEFFNPHQDLASAADCGRAGVAIGARSCQPEQDGIDVYPFSEHRAPEQSRMKLMLYRVRRCRAEQDEIDFLAKKANSVKSY
ncbi:hypothetical protein RHSIM_Rhsim02G0058000 [Rhododendron simsii]|uniref:Uncharacterized protein n=1 Tax=Rhododendron simsii TaxID=118357 RepID=A0A834HBQ7_RHOSS|nr:hypothetical protein RHSIM_Rhsim02G0058000 [Rhododendron simsii]